MATVRHLLRRSSLLNTTDRMRIMEHRGYFSLSSFASKSKSGMHEDAIFFAGLAGVCIGASYIASPCRTALAKRRARLQEKRSAEAKRKTIDKLSAMGVKVYGVAESDSNSSKNDISWGSFAGYNQQKREIEDTILLAFRRPQLYDNITRETRRNFESNRPRAVLFEGPPGTGKTSSARAIANQAGVPFLHVPLEVIVFGESEKLIGEIFSLASELTEHGAIIFLDEIDSIACVRDGMTHEYTRRILSILTRQIDGFEPNKKILVVAATNRKQDIDPALMSRFCCTIYFGLPDEKSRRDIAAQYAKHLTDSELTELAEITVSVSGRGIKDICEETERRWASKMIRGQVKEEEMKHFGPPLKEYIDSAINSK